MLNDRLGLGLSPRKLKKAWDQVLKTFADLGWITERGDGYVFADEANSEEPEPGETARDPELQKLFDRFVGAMHDLWEEGHQCSANN